MPGLGSSSSAGTTQGGPHLPSCLSLQTNPILVDAAWRLARRQQISVDVQDGLRSCRDVFA